MFRPFNHVIKAGCALALAGLAGAAAADASKWPPVNPNAVPAAALARAAAATAATTPRATVVQSIDDDAHAPYKEGQSISCSAYASCIATFATVPAGRRHIVEHVSCIMNVPAPGTMTNFALLTTSYAPARVFINAQRNSIDPTQFSVDASTLMPFEAGEAPMVYATGNFSPALDSMMFCSLFGRDVAAP